MMLSAYIKKFFLFFSFLILFYQSYSQTITSVSPNSALQGQWLNVTISGQNTNFTTGSPTGWLSKPGQNNIPVNPQSVFSDTQFDSYFHIPASADTGLWDVNVNDTTIGTMTLTDGFTILPQNYSPPAPVLVSPSDASVVSGCNASFSWNTSSFANWYEIIVDNDSAFLPPNLLNANYVYTNGYSQPFTLTAGTVYWKVRAYTTYNNYSNWSQTFSFTVNANPQLISVNPDSAQIGQFLTVTIAGSCVNFTQGSPTSWLYNGASTINLDTLYADPYQDSLLFATFTVLFGSDTGWYDVNVASQFYDTLILPNSFYIQPSDPAPDAPTLISPADASVVATCTPTFNWTAPQYAFTYEIMIDNDSDFSSPVVSQANISATSYISSAALTNGIFYWKVRAKNIANIFGNWSQVYSFTSTAMPSLISSSPDSAQQGQQVYLNISGQCTNFTQNPQVWLSSGSSVIQSVYVYVYSDSSLTTVFNIPFNSELCALWDINVYTVFDDTIFLSNVLAITGNNRITGKVFNDINGNCIFDSADVPIDNVLIKLEPGPKYATTNYLGEYVFPDTGNFTITQIIQSPAWAQNCPVSPSTYNVTATACQSSNNNDFADTLYNCPILEVDISVSTLRNCVHRWYYIQYCNNGTAYAYNVSIELTPDQYLIPFYSSVPWTQQGGIYSFNIGTVQPYYCGGFTLEFDVSCNSSIGDTLCVYAKILPVITCGGVDTMGYQTEIDYCRIVVGSYDPNEKLLLNPMTAPPDYFVHPDSTLEYQINFQNTGTDTAFNIIVRDTLSALFDVETVQSGVSSHPYTFRIYGQGILEWTFDNILLPDSFVNEPASHGFVKYKVKPKTNLPEGTVVTNTAAIYFDFNDPVLTNATANMLSTVIIPVTKKITRVVVYPNPFNEGTTFNFIHKGNELYSIEIYDLLGKKVTAINGISTKTYFLRNSSFQSGVYFYKVYSSENIIGLGKLIVH